MEKRPPATSRLALMLQNPDLFAIDFNYQNTREALLEISAKIAELNESLAGFENLETKYVTPRELQAVSKIVNDTNKKIESNAEEIASQIKELRGYFTFQIKETNAKIDSTVTTILSEVANSTTASTPVVAEGDSPTITRTAAPDPLLRSDIDTLKTRIDSLFDALQASSNITHQQQAPTAETSAPTEEPANVTSSSTPQLAPLQLPGTPKATQAKSFVEMKLDDTRIQVDGLTRRLAALEQNSIPMHDSIQAAKAKVDVFNQDYMKSKTDLVIIKSNIDQLNTKLADILETKPVDIEAPLQAMRNQFIEQFGKMESAFNDQILKLKAEISELKGETIEAQPTDQVVSLAAQFAEQEPAEKKVIEQMRVESQTETKRKKPTLIQELPRSLDDPQPKATSNVEYATAEVQTVENGGSLFKFDNFSECKNIPSNMVVSVLVDSPPAETPAKEEIARPKEVEQTLSVTPTTIFEYSEIGVLNETEALASEIATLKESLARHERAIEKLEETPQTPAEPPQQERQEPIVMPVTVEEVQEIKTQCRENATAIDDLRHALDLLRNAPPAPQVPSSPIAMPSTEEKEQVVTRQIVLSPVLFTPLNIVSPNVFEMPSAAESTRQTPGKRVSTVSEEVSVKTPNSLPIRPRRKSDVVQKVAFRGQERETPAQVIKPHKSDITESNVLKSEKVPKFKFADPVPGRHRRQSDEISRNPADNQETAWRESQGHRRRQTHAHEDRRHLPHRSRSSRGKHTGTDVAANDSQKPDETSQPTPVPPFVPETPGETEQTSQQPVAGEQLPIESESKTFEHKEEEESSGYLEEDEHVSEEYDPHEELEKLFDPQFKEVNGKIANHQDQLRILREAIVELRTQLQVMQSRSEQRGFSGIPQIQIDTSPTDSPQENKSDEVIRVLRRRFDAQTREFEQDILDLRREIMEIREIQSKTPATVTERIIEVQVPAAETPQAPTPAAPPKSAPPETQEVEKPQPVSTPPDSPRLITVTPMQVPSIIATPKRRRAPIVDPPPEPQPLPRVDPYHTLPQETPKPQPRMPAQVPVVETPSPRDLAPTDSSRRPVFQKIIPQQIEELKILSANDEIEARIVNLIVDVRTQLQLQTDQNTDRLNELTSRTEAYVTKDYVQTFFTKLKAVMSELSSGVSSLKQAMPERVTKEELQEVVEDLFRSLAPDNETSGGTSSYKCLLCGRPRTAISGMIKDRQVVQALGEPTEATATAGLSNADKGAPRGTIIYGPDKQMYRGRGNFGRPTTAGIEGARRGALPSLERK